MIFPINNIKYLLNKYNNYQLKAVMERDYFTARNLGVSLDDYLSLIR